MIQFIIQQVKAFGKLFSNKTAQKKQEHIDQNRKFRMTLGKKTYVSQDPGFVISNTQLAFDEAFSFVYDDHSIVLYAQIYKQHQFLDNSDLDSIICAQFDLSDITSMNGDRMETNAYNSKGQAIGKLTMMIEVFKKNARFSQKVVSSTLIQVVKQQKARQASNAAKNIKNLMVNNALTNTLMTINFLQVVPQKQDLEIFNRESFIMMRYGLANKAFSKIHKILDKNNISWQDYHQFLKNQDVKFQFFFLYYDELNNLVCKAKGQIKYIVFDQTINNHTITLFDRKSTIYGDLMVKFVQKEVQLVNIQNKIQKRLKQQQTQIMVAIDEFNKFKFQSKHNNHILSQKLRELQLKKLAEQQEKMKPLDNQEIKKREQHSRFIDFLQKQVIKIQKQLKKRQIQEKKDERKNLYHANISQKPHDKKFGISMSSSEFKELGHKKEQFEETNRIYQQKNE